MERAASPLSSTSTILEIHKKSISKNDKMWNISQILIFLQNFQNFRIFQLKILLKTFENIGNFENFGKSSFFRKIFHSFPLFEMDFLWIFKNFDVLERGNAALSNTCKYNVYLWNMLPWVSVLRYPWMIIKNTITTFYNLIKKNKTIL